MSEFQGFIVYTDGSCYHADRIGAYAWVVIDEDEIEVTGGDWATDTTISRMELWGPLEALTQLLSLRGPSVVLIYSDSEYVVKGAMNRTRGRKKHSDLWTALDAAIDAHELVVFEHVYGHKGDHYNEMVDKMAGKLRKQGQSEQNDCPNP